MRNINITKVTNIVSITAVLAVSVMPLLAGAQFTVPTVGNTGVVNEANFSDILVRIINILLGVAGLIAVVFLIVGGFRYITAGGNEETAEAAKKTITNSIIGIVIILLAFVIVRVISNALIHKNV